MRVKFCLVIAFVLSTAFAQDDASYTFMGQTSDYRIIVHNDIAVGDSAVEITTSSKENPETTLSVIGLIYTGVEADGTLHLIRTSNDYSLGAKENFEVYAVAGEPTSFGGILGKPFNVHLTFTVGENRKLGVTLTNASDFSISTR